MSEALAPCSEYMTRAQFRNCLRLMKSSVPMEFPYFTYGQIAFEKSLFDLYSHKESFCCSDGFLMLIAIGLQWEKSVQCFEF